MPLVAAIQVPVSTKDPREAVRDCIAMAREKATNIDAVQVDLNLMCTSNREVMMRLAERLPANALGFRGLPSDRAQTAREFSAAPPGGFCSFSGNLTEHLLPSDAFALIEQLLKSPPGAIRQTSFSLDIGKIHWNGSPEESSGDLYLSDFKAFQRASRFSLSARLRFSGEDPKSNEAREVLRQVTQATGLAFDSADISHVLGEKARTPEYAQAELVGEICFDEALEDVAAEIPRHWFSEFAPSALSHFDAIEKRAGQWGMGEPARVNLASVVKRVVKDLFPEVRFETAEGDEILFTKSLGAQSELLVQFIKALPRLGKAFELWLGVRSKDQGTRFVSNVSRFNRTTRPAMWVYNDTTAAEEVVREAVTLARELLPRFESALRPRFASPLAELPPGIEQHGKLTAREAFGKARDIALKRFADAVLVRLSDHARSVTVRDLQGPQLTFDGRLGLNAAWRFHFYSEEADVSLQVTVPAVGRIIMLDHGGEYARSTRNLPGVGDDWIDSDRAFALAEKRGGRQRRSSGETFGIGAKVETLPPGQVCWEIRYLVADERGRNDLTIRMDAVTGEEIREIPGL
jgi:hypothetical protein